MFRQNDIEPWQWNHPRTGPEKAVLLAKPQPIARGSDPEARCELSVTLRLESHRRVATTLTFKAPPFMQLTLLANRALQNQPDRSFWSNAIHSHPQQ